VEQLRSDEPFWLLPDTTQGPYGACNFAVEQQHRAFFRECWKVFVVRALTFGATLLPSATSCEPLIVPPRSASTLSIVLMEDSIKPEYCIPVVIS
jgi:hypothetical protein